MVNRSLYKNKKREKYLRFCEKNDSWQGVWNQRNIKTFQTFFMMMEIIGKEWPAFKRKARGVKKVLANETYGTLEEDMYFNPNQDHKNSQSVVIYVLWFYYQFRFGIMEYKFLLLDIE